MTYESFLDNARLARAKERVKKLELIALVAQYNKLLEDVESEDYFVAAAAEDALEEFLAEFPNIGNYDSRGNYVGSVSNENGWTP